MWSEWLVAPGSAYLMVAVSFACVYAAIIALTRIVGLRSFSKMSAPDFAMTVAVGSLFASSISTSSPQIPLALFALACLFAGQWLVAATRRKSRRAAALIDNAPVLLMRGPVFLERNMTRTLVSRADVFAKLREANVLELDEVHAVVFEATGDISVLHGPPDGPQLDSELLHGVDCGEPD